MRLWRMARPAMAFAMLAGVMVFSQSPAAFADEAELAALQAALPGKLMNDPTRIDWPVYGQGQKSKRVKTPGVGGGAALQVTSPVASPAAHSIGVNVPLKAGVVPGQAITIAFWARAVSADTPDGNGRIGLRIQMDGPPWTGFGDNTLSVGPDWKLHEVKVQANTAIEAGHATLGFQLAAARQVIEIGQLFVLDMGVKPAGGGAVPAAEIRMPVPEGLPGTLLNDPASLNWGVYGTQTYAKVATPDAGGGYALRVTSPAAQEKAFAIGVSVPLLPAIKTGQNITIAFWARAAEADTPDGNGRLGLRIQMNGPPYTGFGDNMLSIGRDWKLYQVKTQSNLDAAAGNAVLGFQLAAARQVLELGQIFVLDMGAK